MRQLELGHRRHRDSGKGLVDFPEVDIADIPAIPGQQLGNRAGWRGGKPFGCLRMHCMAMDARHRLQTELGGPAFEHQQHRGSAIGDRRGSRCGDRAVLDKGRPQAGDLVELGLERLFVAADDDVAAAAGDRHRGDFPGEAAIFIGAPCPLGRRHGKSILGRTAETVPGHALLGENTHRLAAFIGIFEPVKRHMVKQLRCAVFDAFARMHQMRRIAHALHAAGDHDLGAAGFQGVMREHHGPHTGTAHLRQRHRADRLRQTGFQHRLARRRLTLTRHQAVADQGLIDQVGGNAGALDRGLNRRGTQLPGCQAGEIAEQTTDRRACGRNDDNGIRHD